MVLTYDLLEERRIDDDSAQFKFDSCVILWTNHNSLLRIATNQFASFCIDNGNVKVLFRVCQSGEIWNKKACFPFNILILYDIKEIDNMLPCICSVIDHRRRQNVVRTLVTHSAAPRLPLLFLPHFDVICDLLLNRRTATWNLLLNIFNNYSTSERWIWDDR